MTWGRRKDLKIINEQDLEQLRVKSPKFWKIEAICLSWHNIMAKKMA